MRCTNLYIIIIIIIIIKCKLVSVWLFQDWFQAVRIWHTQSVNFVVEYCQMLLMQNSCLLLVFSSVDSVQCLWLV